MTGRIIQLPADRHREIQSLLPWYVAGALDEAEQAEVRAHLAGCAECQAELSVEHRLSEALDALPADAGALDVEHGWKAMRQMMDKEPRKKGSFLAAWTTWLGGGRGKERSPEAPWLHWALAAQFCLVLLLGVGLWRTAQPARYHVLGAAPVSAAANVVVIFRPETPEKVMRTILRANEARLVDGPTEADAYLIHVPEAGRAAALAHLRRQAQVVLAEPVDAGQTR
jgi:hypothetical protein